MPDKEFYAFALGKAGLSAIPIIGGSLASILADIQSVRNEARLRDFITQFSEDMASRKDNIQPEYVNNPDFSDILLNITEDAMKQRTVDKRMYLKNLLINSITKEKTSYDATEELQRLIDILSIFHFKILKVFYEDRSNQMQKAINDTIRIMNMVKERNIIDKPLFAATNTASATSSGGVLIINEKNEQKITNPFDLPVYDGFHINTYLSYVKDLENQGLVDHYNDNVSGREGGVTYESDSPYITPKGQALIEYITLDACSSQNSNHD